MNKLILFAIVILIYVAGCSPNKIQNEPLNISVSHTEVSSWLNLMPGGPPSFHITGIVKIKNEETYDIVSLHLSEITIFQETVPLYSFEPIFETLDENKPVDKINAGEEKDFRFLVKNGLRVKPELDSEKRISASLIFKFPGKTFEYIIPDILIEKAY